MIDEPTSDFIRLMLHVRKPLSCAGEVLHAMRHGCFAADGAGLSAQNYEPDSVDGTATVRATAGECALSVFSSRADCGDVHRGALFHSRLKGQMGGFFAMDDDGARCAIW